MQVVNLPVIHFNVLQGESGELQFLPSYYSGNAFRGKVSAIAAWQVAKMAHWSVSRLGEEAAIVFGLNWQLCHDQEYTWIYLTVLSHTKSEQLD